MSKFLAIEQALQQCSEGQFEKVVGQVLHARGVRGISLLGSVIGKYKTRTGVPDAFASAGGERFSLLAATTTSDSAALKSKLRQDIDDCSNPDRTGIPLARIDRLYVAFNSVLPADVLIELAKHSRQRGVEPEFVSLSELAGDVARRFPWIARDEFCISVDTGQILSIDAFVEHYDRGKLATPLSTRFHFREDAMANALEELGAADLLISGPPGTGKTRFALEIARRCEQMGAVVRCILSQGLPLYEDIARHFCEAREYVVVIDDANRVNGVEHLLHEALSPVPGRRIRFVLTARDYAQAECMAALKQLGRPFREITLAPFSRDETDKYVAETFGINNGDFQRQIWQLSRGNARLATMAARQAVLANRLDAIRNVTDLYDAYYGDLVRELDKADPMLLRLLSLVAVFRVVRANDVGLIQQIELRFGLCAGLLWEAIDRLHGLECVDLHDRRVAKCSDQVLAGFAFYLCFVARRDLSFGLLLSGFGATHLRRIRDSVYGALSTMDRERVFTAISPGCQAAMRAVDGDRQLQLMESFWFIEPDLALTKVAQALRAGEPATGALEFPEKASLHHDVRLRILGRFANDPDRRPAAAGMAIDFALHMPSSAASVLSLLVAADGFGVDKYSHHTEYAAQREVVKLLVDRTTSDARLAPLLAMYVGASLSTEFEAHFAEDDRVHWMFIPLQPCEGLSDWRRALWHALRLLLEREDSVRLGKQALRQYATGWCAHYPEVDVLTIDVEWIRELFQEVMQPDRFEDCRLAQIVGMRLRRAGLNEFAPIAETFHCEEIKLLEVTALHTEQLAEADYEELVQARHQRVIEQFGSLAPGDLRPLVTRWAQVASSEADAARDLWLSWRLLLSHIGEEDPERLVALTDAYLALGAQPNLIGATWIAIVVHHCGREAGWELLSRHAFADRRDWLIEFYLQLQPEQINRDDASALITLLAPPGVAVPWLHALRGFVSAAPTFLPDLVEALLAQRAETAGEACRELLNHIDADADLTGALAEQFSGHPDLLASAYLKANSASEHRRHFDYSATVFNLLLDLNPGFMARYVAERMEQKRWLLRSSEQDRDYSRLWARPDWPAQLHELLRTLARCNDGRCDAYVAAWLPCTGRGEEASLSEAALEVLLAFIGAHASEQDCMEVLFAGLVEIAPAQRLKAISTFLQTSHDLDAFTRLELLPSHWGGSGSMVPVLQRRANFLQRVKELLSGPNFIAHRLRVSEELGEALRKVDWMAEREFADADWS